MSANIRHCFNQTAQTYELTVDAGSLDAYKNLFEGVLHLLADNPGYIVLGVTGPYLLNEDALALDVYIDN